MENVSGYEVDWKRMKLRKVKLLPAREDSKFFSEATGRGNLDSGDGSWWESMIRRLKFVCSTWFEKGKSYDRNPSLWDHRRSSLRHPSHHHQSDLSVSIDY
jgi:hypothetical protein